MIAFGGRAGFHGFLGRLSRATVPASVLRLPHLPAASLTPTHGVRAVSAVSSSEAEYDVVVVGAGVVGSLFALRLAASPEFASRRIALIEGQKPPRRLSEVENLEIPDLRTFAITPASSKAFHDVGVWESMLAARANPFQSMQVWDTVSDSYARFDASADGADSVLGHIVENRVLTSALGDAIDVSAVETFYETRVKSVKLPKLGGPDAHVDMQVVRADSDKPVRIKSKLVVAADGGNSYVRQACHIGTWGWDYAQRAMVATVRTSAPHSTAWQRFLPSGPIAILPLWNDYSSIVWSTTPEHAAELQSLSPEEFSDAVNAAFNAPSESTVPEFSHTPLAPLLSLFEAPASALTHTFNALTARHQPFRYPPHIEETVGPRGSFPLKLSHANEYVKRGLALIGDAAHTTHPLAGQGLNLGVADAVALIESLERGSVAGDEPGAITALREYESSRKVANMAMINGLDVVKRLYAGDAGPLSWLRSVGVSALNAADPLKALITRYATTGKL